MDYANLKVMLRERKIEIVPKEAMRVRGFGIEAYRKLALQTGRIDYDCDFRYGLCRSQRAEERSCCSKCAATFGYWCKEGGRLDEDTAEKWHHSMI